MSSQNLFLPRGHYVIDDKHSPDGKFWWKNRPNYAWRPFGVEGQAILTSRRDGYKDRKGNDVVFKGDHSDAKDNKSNEPQNCWNGDASTAYKHKVNHAKAHESYAYIRETLDINKLHQAHMAPITNFTGIKFKFDRSGSYYASSADTHLRIKPLSGSNFGIALVCYDPKSSVIYFQRVFEDSWYKQSAIAWGNGTDTGCRSAWMLPEDDIEWVKKNRIYLTGFYIQFQASSTSGPTSRLRSFNIYDLQPIYNVEDCPYQPNSPEKHMVQYDLTDLAVQKHVAGAELKLWTS